MLDKAASRNYHSIRISGLNIPVHLEGLAPQTSMSPRPSILDHTALLSETTRCRILQVVDGHELTVSELCGVLQLPQSTVSRHLKQLADGAWVDSRRDGTSNLYRLRAQADASARNLWDLIRSELAGSEIGRQDRRRLESVLAERRSRSRAFFSAGGEQWDRLRDDLFGRRFDLEAFLSLLGEGWVVGDLGCGTGRTTEMLVPFVRQVIAVDGSDAMLESARRRLGDADRVSLRQGDLESLPITDRSLDLAVLLLTLHHVPDPGAVLREAHRVLKPGGRFLLVDMLPHAHEEYRQEMGHVWLGFSAERVRQELAQAGFDSLRFHPLRPEPEAVGPGLFAAVARRSVADGAADAASPEDSTLKEPEPALSAV